MSIEIKETEKEYNKFMNNILTNTIYLVLNYGVMMMYLKNTYCSTFESCKSIEI